MGRSLAELVYAGIIAALFVSDWRTRKKVSFAMLIPLAWAFVIASRPVGMWLNPNALGSSTGQFVDGSPIDRNFYIGLIVAAGIVLLRRRIEWGAVIKNNLFVVLFIAYCGLSIAWSDYPFISMKRWVKELGTFLMVLVVLTDVNPDAAMKTLFRRLSFLLIPLSVLFVKYLPELGRFYSRWTWEWFYVGVTDGKNSLGALGMLAGIFFMWTLIRKESDPDLKQREQPAGAPPSKTAPVPTASGAIAKKPTREPLWPRLLILVMTAWLLQKAQSATAVGCVLLASATFFSARMFGFSSRLLKGVLAASAIFAAVAAASGGLPLLYEFLGRDATLTGRTDVWGLVLSVPINEMIGTGYESFWLGDRTEVLTRQFSFPINQAHNGFIEIYLSLGLIGVALFAGIIIGGFRNILRALDRRAPLAVFRLVCLIAVVLSNITEAGVRSTSLMWFMLLLIASEAPAVTEAVAKAAPALPGRREFTVPQRVRRTA